MMSGARRFAGDVTCTIRPSVAAIAGWPSGYSVTARAAALHARAKSVSCAACSGVSGARASVVSAMSEKRQRIDAERLRIHGLDDGARMLALAVPVPRVHEHRLLDHRPRA